MVREWNECFHPRQYYAGAKWHSGTSGILTLETSGWPSCIAATSFKPDAKNQCNYRNIPFPKTMNICAYSCNGSMRHSTCNPHSFRKAPQASACTERVFIINIQNLTRNHVSSFKWIHQMRGHIPSLPFGIRSADIPTAFTWHHNTKIRVKFMQSVQGFTQKSLPRMKGDKLWTMFHPLITMQIIGRECIAAKGWLSISPLSYSRRPVIKDTQSRDRKTRIWMVTAQNGIYCPGEYLVGIRWSA